MRDGRDGRAFAVAVWIILAAGIIAGTAGVAGGILSPALVPDLVALWPLPALALASGLVGRWLARRAERRYRAVLPLSLFTGLVLVASLHLGGWDGLPSAQVRLTGPPADDMSDPTEFVVQISGEVVVAPTEAAIAYHIEPILRGGRVGVPEATETSVDGNLSITLAADAGAPGWYRFAGWEIGLSPQVPWRLVLNGELDADLTAFDVTSGAMAGSGTVRLGEPPEGGGSVIVAGDILVLVPPGAAVVVDGEAVVPSDWEETRGGYRSNAADEGDRWSISVQGDVDVEIGEG